MFSTRLQCETCGNELELGAYFGPCPNCLKREIISEISVKYDYEAIKNVLSKETLSKRSRIDLWRFGEFLPVENQKNELHLGDGCTPLIEARSLAKEFGIKRLYIKDESRNLTWSFKDRLACVGVARALDFGAKMITGLSTGNHGAASAAHASAAGLRSVIFTVPYIPKTMEVYMRMVGAMLVPIDLPEDKFGDYPYDILRTCVEKLNWYPLTTYTVPPATNAYAVEGYKTIGHEICEDLNWKSPDFVLFPTGQGDGFSKCWKGFSEMVTVGFVEDSPKMIAIQPTGASPLAEAVTHGLDVVPRIAAKSTVQFSTGVSSSSNEALKAIKNSHGSVATVSDEEAISAQKNLGMKEGIFSEQSSASSVAALPSLIEKGIIDRDCTVVCVITSSGLKDTSVPENNLPHISPIRNNWNSFVDFLKTTYQYDIS